MQFPVPQFTDVEDKIIGSLTFKQFGILFGVGIIIFLAYSSTKSVLIAVFFFVLFGLPGLGLAFGKINGRPVYNAFGFFLRFLNSPKFMVFHKEASRLNDSSKFKNLEFQKAEEAAGPAVTAETTQTRLKEVQQLLQKQAAEEADIQADKMK